MKAKYVHTNLIAFDWEKLADFYIKVFGCEFVPPERDYKGKEIDAGTGLSDTHLKGVHLRLPGLGAEGPTLEIYSYNYFEPRLMKKVNQPGYGHIAFEVDDVSSARSEVINNGGDIVGDIVTVMTKTGDKVTWCYLTDPEGNIIEIQSWEKNLQE